MRCRNIMQERGKTWAISWRKKNKMSSRTQTILLTLTIKSSGLKETTMVRDPAKIQKGLVIKQRIQIYCFTLSCEHTGGKIFYASFLQSSQQERDFYLPNTVRYPRAMMVKLFNAVLT